MSIYGETFADEGFHFNHSGPGLLSMANNGPNSNGCQLSVVFLHASLPPLPLSSFITCGAASWLDGKHVVFGRVLDGMDVVRRVEAMPVGQDSRPLVPVVISQCGEL
jgi:peptidyl-prolyl isomerase H (cyclophilin H)